MAQSLLTRSSTATRPLRSAPSKAATSRWTRSSGSEDNCHRGGISSHASSYKTRTRPHSCLRDSGPHPSMEPSRGSGQVCRHSCTVIYQSQLLQTDAGPRWQQHNTPHSTFITNTTFKPPSGTWPSGLGEDILLSDPSDIPKNALRSRGPASKENFKERGSLIYSSNPSIPSTKRRESSFRQWPERKKAKGDGRTRKVEKKVKTDLYIPTTVTVGQFARLLNVRLGVLCFCVILLWIPYSCIPCQTPSKRR